MKAKLPLVLLCTLIAIGLSARTRLKPSWNLFSHDEDIELGRAAQKQVEQKVHIVDNPELNRYVAALGKKLVSVAPYNDYPFTFKVIRDKSINAFALPGGPVYVNTGTIEQAENESQLAGVIAHEIGHIVLRHPTHAASSQSLAKGAVAIVGAVLGAGDVTNAAVALGLNPIFLHNSREAEKQADLLGAQIVYDSGQWNPAGLARFFEKLEHEPGDRPIEFLSDHPNPGNRVQLVSAEVASLGRAHRGAADEASDFLKMRRIAAEIDRSLPSASHGSAPAPATVITEAFKPYNAKNYRISYPGNWQISENGAVVNIAPPDSVTADGIMAGAMISYQQAGDSLDEATGKLVTRISRDNPGTRQDGASRHVTVGGLNCVSASLVGPSQQGGTEIDWLVTAQRPDGSLWYIVFIANERDYARLRLVFQQMLDSVRLVN